MGKVPHVLAIPFPAQGHVIPMMEIAQCLANNGLRVTFVNTEFNHERVMKAISQTGSIHELISLVSVPDGLEPWEDRNDHGKLAEGTLRVMPGKLETLIEEINGTSDEITCFLVDFYMAGTLRVAEKFGIKRAAFLPAAVAMLALTLNAQKLVDDGIVDDDGTPLEEQVIQLSPSMPKMLTTHFVWANFPDLATRRAIFQAIIENNETAKLAHRLICNSSQSLEAGALAFVPHCSPIGPLLASSRLGHAAGNFWPEDSTCLTWLDQQPPNSVVYVAFGSFTILNAIQFQELALGLELAKRPFLWVVRQDNEQTYPPRFVERVDSCGKMVHWAPQQKVLSHPSVACFLSHCGWNSTMESLSNGVPFLCWPYFADQFLNQSYIVHDWKVGLSLEKDENGIIGKDEIKNKVEMVLSDGSFKARVLELQAKAADSVQGGSSKKNFHKFMDWIKENDA